MQFRATACFLYFFDFISNHDFVCSKTFFVVGKDTVHNHFGIFKVQTREHEDVLGTAVSRNDIARSQADIQYIQKLIHVDVKFIQAGGSAVRIINGDEAEEGG